MTPAASAAAKLTQTDGAETKTTMHTPSAARTVAANRSDGKCCDRRSDPSTLPAPSAAMNPPDQPCDTPR